MSKQRPAGGKLLRIGVTFAALVVAPFVILVRVSSALHAWGYGPWVAIGVSIVATAVVVGAAGTWVLWRVTGRLHPRIVTQWLAVPLVTAFSVTGLLYVADTNTKTPEVRQEYRSLHPVLRIALATLILADDGLVITDASRVRGDYAQMGLPALERSDHYVGPTGYATAVDLRTMGRPEWRNWLLDKYFRVVGFRTLRHVGTADHLHVALQR